MLRTKEIASRKGVGVQGQDYRFTSENDEITITGYIGDGGDNLTKLIHYVHLNPVRAGRVKRSDGWESYPWSSLSDYMKPPRKRRPWVAVDRGLGHVDIPDNAAGRR